jgi:hypothetical protein
MWLDSFMGWLSDKLSFLPKLGGGKSWMVGSVRVHLWPFVAFGIFVAALLVYHFGFAT